MDRNTIITIAKILINEVRQSHTISYGELARAMGMERRVPATRLAAPLGKLSTICQYSDLPLISSIVINRQTGMPGAGFYNEFFSGVDEADWPDIFTNERNSVFANYNALTKLPSIIK